MIITCYYSLQTKGDAFKSQIYTKFIQECTGGVPIACSRRSDSSFCSHLFARSGRLEQIIGVPRYILTEGTLN